MTPKTSRLRDWYTGTYYKIARVKEGNMGRKRFKGLLDEFPLEFDSLKGLTKELRRALFPVQEESLFTGTYRSPNKLYKPMIDAFDRVIAKYRREL
jgi:hypothetical protein